MLSLYHFYVFGYNSTNIVMFVCFYCYLSFAVIFSHLSFCNCKGSTAENCSEEASQFGKRNVVKTINKLIGSTKWLSITISMNATRPLFLLKTLNCYDIGWKTFEI